ncbi:alpha-N-acetylneuraminide alpha-2,8-sialyltransferase-like [Gadus morhua]|uniref:alpha-N-acetylneuraminide alpha-2,8-sialyltransferase-like n=1 Tax=Gadus morhua TaxID=8049 RepID=UPI0011B4DA4C|nr:alpha-N-acetylneuraminide alpha-2,8-sialyltransferase-like [Gadus morhua]
MEQATPRERSPGMEVNSAVIRTVGGQGQSVGFAEHLPKVVVLLRLGLDWGVKRNSVDLQSKDQLPINKTLISPGVQEDREREGLVLPQEDSFQEGTGDRGVMETARQDPSVSAALCGVLAVLVVPKVTVPGRGVPGPGHGGRRGGRECPGRSHAPQLSIDLSSSSLILSMANDAPRMWSSGLYHQDITCQGYTKAVMTQENTPVGSQIVYDGAKGNTSVTSDIFDTLAKKNPFSSKPWDTCSVVGNGGILSNSTCGEMIDSAQFVIRCNLPPVESSHLKDVGKKTGLVTANPSILNQKFSGLLDRRRPFVDSMSHYKDALILLPAFTLSKNIQPSLRVVYTIEESLSPIRPVFLNPEYIRNLHSFWSSKGLNKRLSSGFMVASLALELCTNVHLYGFWPFDQHPLLQQPLNNHYYDNIQSKKKVHAMPDEFDHLLRLHEQGVLKIHLGECV